MKKFALIALFALCVAPAFADLTQTVDLEANVSDNFVITVNGTPAWNEDSTITAGSATLTAELTFDWIANTVADISYSSRVEMGVGDDAEVVTDEGRVLNQVPLTVVPTTGTVLDDIGGEFDDDNEGSVSFDVTAEFGTDEDAGEYHVIIVVEIADGN